MLSVHMNFNGINLTLNYKLKQTSVGQKYLTEGYTIFFRQNLFWELELISYVPFHRIISYLILEYNYTRIDK